MRATSTQAAAASSSGILSSEGRVNRIHYFCVGMITASAAYLITMKLGEVFQVILVLPLAWIHLVAAIKRCHDVDMSGWACLLWLLPIANLALGLYLIFKRGTEYSNEYGPPP